MVEASSDVWSQVGGCLLILVMLQKYNYVVVQREQPLLIAEETGAARFKVPGQAQVCVLIPELCNPTGLTDPMRENFQFMKAMADQTMQIPLDRMKNLYGLMEDLLG